MHNKSHPEFEKPEPPASTDTSGGAVETELQPASTKHVTGLALINDSKLKIPGDVVNKATASLPDNQRSAIRWYHAHYIENAMSLDEAATAIRLSAGTLSMVFRGKYPAKLENVVKEIESFRELHERRSQGRKMTFIPTALTNRIWQVCEAAIEFQRIGFIFGDTQIGKSEALKAYEITHNHGSTIRVEVPTGGALIHFLAKLASRLRISPQLRKADLRRRIIEAFDDRMLLIVDEAHRCTPEGSNSVFGIQTIEFVRELHDERNCGVVICATNVFRKAMEDGPAMKLLRQTKRRRLCALQLPNSPTREDLNTFAAAYGLSPATGEARELEKRIVEDEALGMWLTLLRMAAKLAAQKKAKMEWAHVISANKGLEGLEKCGS